MNITTITIVMVVGDGGEGDDCVYGIVVVMVAVTMSTCPHAEVMYQGCIKQLSGGLARKWVWFKVKYLIYDLSDAVANSLITVLSLWT